MKPENILEIRNLRVKFPVTGGLFLRKVAEIKAMNFGGLHDSVTIEQTETRRLGLPFSISPSNPR